MVRIGEYGERRGEGVCEEREEGGREEGGEEGEAWSRLSPSRLLLHTVITRSRSPSPSATPRSSFYAVPVTGGMPCHWAQHACHCHDAIITRTPASGKSARIYVLPGHASTMPDHCHRCVVGKETR